MALPLGSTRSGAGHMSTSVVFGELDNAKLAALIFELAAQLHLERTRRLALEATLAQRGIVMPSDIEMTGAGAAFREEARNTADLAIRKLLRVLSESSDERVPLRGEAPATGET
jgi:hypothetical protein